MAARRVSEKECREQLAAADRAVEAASREAARLLIELGRVQRARDAALADAAAMRSVAGRLDRVLDALDRLEDRAARAAWRGGESAAEAYAQGVAEARRMAGTIADHLPDGSCHPDCVSA